jgi:hypothetical protein
LIVLVNIRLPSDTHTPVAIMQLLGLNLPGGPDLLDFSNKWWLAGELGFEPRQTESESVVLPLHHSPRITEQAQ